MDRDEVLWKRTLAGDADAYGALFERYRDRVYTHCLQRTLSSSESEDITAEVFAETWRRRDHVILTDAAGLRPWLLSTANNMLNAGWRKARTARSALHKLRPDDVPDIAEEVTEEAARDHHLRLLATTLASLSRTDRDVVHLCVTQGLSPSEVARVTGESAGTVRSRLSRALVRARGQFFGLLEQDDPQSANKGELK